MPNHSDRIFCEQHVRERLVSKLRLTMPPQCDGNDGIMPAQFRNHRGIFIDVAEQSSMKNHQRMAMAVYLIVDLGVPDLKVMPSARVVSVRYSFFVGNRTQSALRADEQQDN